MRRRLVAAPDKFRGTARASDLAAAMAAAARDSGWDAIQVPVSDGGEGLLDCFGGANRVTEVTGPLGAPVAAGWRLDATRAVVESAQASGLSLVAGANDPVAATTRGTGELVAAALRSGAREVIVGAGGSATTDGGAGAVAVLEQFAPLDGSAGVLVTVAVDVQTRFLDAARRFAPQKGADAGQVARLSTRLEQVAQDYRDRFGIDVTELPGAGAAGGLAGGLAALGARVVPGFDVVAGQLRLAEQIAGADLVVTGEGRLDATSLLGKAPIGVARLAAEHRVPCLLVAGRIAADLQPAQLEAGSFSAVSLAERFGADAARTLTLRCARMTVRAALQ